MNHPLNLTDLPRSVPISLYDETREEVRRKYRETPGVVEVLEFGLIPLPGISDMDFFVLTEPGSTVAFPRTGTYTPEQKWAMLHMHFAVSRNAFEDLRCFDPWLMQIVPLLHSDSRFAMENVRQLDEEARHALSYDHVMVSWLLAATEAVAQITATREVHVREFLEMIKGTEYCHRELKRATATSTEALPYTTAFMNLRKEWFTIPDADRGIRISEAFDQYKETTKILLQTLTAQLNHIATHVLPVTLPPRTLRHRKLLKKYTGSLIVQTADSTYVYQKGRTESEITYESWKSPLSSRRYGHGTYVFPLSLAATQNAYLMSEGVLSDQYRRCSATDLQELPVLDHPALHHRCHVMNNQVHDTLHVTGSKQPILTYGAELPFHAKGGTLRGQLGGMYDRMMMGIHDTPLGFVAPAQSATVVL